MRVADLRGHDGRVKNKFDYLVRRYEVVRKEFKQTGKGSMENDPNTTGACLASAVTQSTILTSIRIYRNDQAQDVLFLRTARVLE